MTSEHEKQTAKKLKKAEKIILNASKIDCTGCSICTGFKADNLQYAIARLNGVSKVKVDETTGKVTIEYEPQKIILPKITERIEKLGYKVEILSKEEIQ
jgi:copper chaperone CopZ